MSVPSKKVAVERGKELAEEWPIAFNRDAACYELHHGDRSNCHRVKGHTGPHATFTGYWRQNWGDGARHQAETYVKSYWVRGN